MTMQMRAGECRRVPPAVVPGEGLQRDMILLYGDGKVVWVKHCKVPEELLHLVDHLPQVHLCQVLQPQVLNPVGEDYTAYTPAHRLPYIPKYVQAQYLPCTSLSMRGTLLSKVFFPTFSTERCATDFTFDKGLTQVVFAVSGGSELLPEPCYVFPCRSQEAYRLHMVTR